MKKRNEKNRKHRKTAKCREEGMLHLKASATIEAAVVVPITLVIIAAVIMLVFILHDRVIFPAVSIYEAVEQAEKGEDPEVIRTAVSDMLDKRLILAENAEVLAVNQGDGVVVDAGGDVHVPIALVRFLLGEENSRIDTSIHVSNLNGRQMLIRYKTLCDGLSALTAENGG